MNIRPWSLSFWSLLFFFSLVAHAAPRIDVTLDSTAFAADSDTLPSVQVGGQGGDELLNVDIHVALISPDGTIYEYPDWNTDLRPWLPSFKLRAGVQVDPFRLFDLDKVPFQLTPGNWRLAGAITKPGTLEFISLDIQPFTVLSGQATPSRDMGVWIGNLEITDHRSLRYATDNPKIFSRKTATSSFLVFCPNKPFEDLIDPETQPPPEEPVDHCEILTPTEPEPADPRPADCADTIFVDAGEALTVASDQAGTVSVPTNPIAVQAGLISYQADLPEAFFQTETSYTFSGNGGRDIGPFSTSLSIAPLTVFSPDLLSGTTTLDPDNDLLVQWNGQGGQGTIEVEMIAVNPDYDPANSGTEEKPTRTLRCVFSDDGEGTIPASLISALTSGLDGTFPFPPVTMIVTRKRSVEFNTQDNALEKGTFTLTSERRGDLVLP